MIVPEMGITHEHQDRPTGLADALFTPVQQRVLGLLFGQPDRRFQGVELIRLANAGTGAPHRLLQRLASCGLVRVDAVGRQKFYQANPAAPIHNELVALVRKTVGLREPLREALMPFAHHIKLAFVFGSVAAGQDRADSDIDLMVVTRRLNYSALLDALTTVGEAVGRPVTPNIFSPADWARKRRLKDGLFARVAAGPRLLVIGEDDDAAAQHENAGLRDARRADDEAHRRARRSGR